jgi:hypothetical protein
MGPVCPAARSCSAARSPPSPAHTMATCLVTRAGPPPFGISLRGASRCPRRSP